MRKRWYVLWFAVGVLVHAVWVVTGALLGRFAVGWSTTAWDVGMKVTDPATYAVDLTGPILIPLVNGLLYCCIAFAVARLVAMRRADSAT